MIKYIGQHIFDFIARFRNDVYLENIADGTVASDKFLGLDSNNKIVKETVSAGITVSDSTANTDFPVVFHDESNNLHDDTAAFTYNPSTGSLSLANLLGPTDGDLNIKSDGGVFFTLDTDTDENNQMFTIAETSGGGSFEYNAGRAALDVYSSLSGYPAFNIISTADDALSFGSFTFTKKRTDSSIQAGEDDDVIGGHIYKSYNDAGTPEVTTYAYTHAAIKDASDTDEAGKYTIQVATSDGSTSALQNAFSANGNGTNNTVSTTIGYGAASVVTVPGVLSALSGITFDGVVLTAIQTSAESFADNDTSLMTSAAIDDRINAAAGASPASVSSGSQTSIGIQIARRTITQAEANSMHSTPIEIVPAQGANTVIIPLGGMIRIDRATTQSNSATDWNMHYADQEPGTYLTASIHHIRRFMYNETGDRIYHITPGLASTEVAQNLTDDINKAVEVSFDSAATTDAFTSMDVYLTYYVISIA